jgi:hypothetical protein
MQTSFKSFYIGFHRQTFVFLGQSEMWGFIFPLTLIAGWTVAVISYPYLRLRQTYDPWPISQGLIAGF